MKVEENEISVADHGDDELVNDPILFPHETTVNLCKSLIEES